jgi:hypothetical protein
MSPIEPETTMPVMTNEETVAKRAEHGQDLITDLMRELPEIPAARRRLLELYFNYMWERGFRTGLDEGKALFLTAMEDTRKLFP